MFASTKRLACCCALLTNRRTNTHVPTLHSNTDPIYVIPLFFRSESPTRLAICLLVHPVLLEAGEAVGRGTKGDAVALALRTEAIKSYEEAAEQIVENSIGDSSFKLIMAFYRRFMLLNMGNTQATMFAVVAASIEEASDTRGARFPPHDERAPLLVRAWL